MSKEEKEDISQRYNEKTISNLTYSEIVKLNRESRKGTFMDRSWRNTPTNILEDKNLSRWEKFKNGGYTFRNISDRWSNSFN